MKGIEIFSLRCLESAARLGSLTAAARELAVSQPAVSVQIAAIERHLGARLLERGARGVRPTQAGEAALIRAIGILDAVRSLEGAAGTGPLSGTLRIGATDVVVLHRLPSVLQLFRRRHPGVELELRIEGSLPLVQALRARTIELALVTLPVAEPPGPIRPLYRDALVFVAAPDHPLAGSRRLSIRRVARFPLLAHRAGSVTRSLIDGEFTARGIVPRISMEVSSPEVMRELARSGLGIAILPRIGVRRELERGSLVELPVGGWDLPRISGLLVPPGGASTRAGRVFVSLLLETAEGAGRLRGGGRPAPTSRDRRGGSRR